MLILESVFDHGIGSKICQHLTLQQVSSLMRTSKKMFERIRNDNSIWIRFAKVDPVAKK